MFCFFNIYTQTKLIKWYMKFLNSKNNIETWNKQTNFKLNHDVTNQMWSKAKLGHLLLLGPFKMLRAWWAWALIMMKWLRLALERHASCELLAFDVDHAYTHLWWAQVVGLEWFKKQFSVSIQSRVWSQAFGLEFIHSIQGSNNYNGLKRWTWAHHGSNNGQTHA